MTSSDDDWATIITSVAPILNQLGKPVGEHREVIEEKRIFPPW